MTIRIQEFFRGYIHSKLYHVNCSRQVAALVSTEVYVVLALFVLIIIISVIIV